MFDSLYEPNESSSLKVRRPHSDIEPQEIIVDRLAREREEEGFEGRSLEVPLSGNILKLSYALFTLVIVFFGFKVVQLQFFSEGQWNALAEKNLVREIISVSERGVIYDRNFLQLAFNEPSFDFVCDKRDMPDSKIALERELKIFADITKLDFRELKEDFDLNPNPFLLVDENLSHEELLVLGARLGEFAGCEIQENTKRGYTKGEMVGHVLGYTAKISREELARVSGYSVADQIGKDGVEKSYETVLRGIPGKIFVEKDALGNTVGKVKENDPVPGSSLLLWLDMELQETLYEALQKVFADTGTKKAAAVALDPRTGGVLALLSLPGFDNALLAGGISAKDWEALSSSPLNPLFNRAMGGIGYPTGSVIKPLIGTAALEEHIIEENTTLFAPLELCVENIYTKEQECFRDWTFHGDTDIKRAIAESVNTFFYIVGGGYDGRRGLGPEKIKEYIARFGWGETTGIDLVGEGKGVLPVFDKNWRLGDTYHFSIGQGPFAVTPLQVASAFGAIANGGTLWKPRTVKALLDSQKNTIQEFQPQAIREGFISRESIDIVRKGMRQTVTAGSAKEFLKDLPLKAAAKTGTAQTGRKTPDGKDYLYAWTVAFAPYENPEIVLVVVVEDAKETQVAALPVVRAALERYFTK